MSVVTSAQKMKPLAHRILVALGLGLSLIAADLPLSAADDAALTGARKFVTSAAVAAQRNFVQGQEAARQTFLTELNAGLKIAMTSGDIDEANAINGTKKLLEGGGNPPAGAAFKTVGAKAAQLKYERAVATLRDKYERELQAALRPAMTVGNLDEANTIRSELKALGVAVSAASPASNPPSNREGRVAQGLLLKRYPMHATQETGNRYAGYVPYAELGNPIGAPKAGQSLSKWSKDVNENAVVSGFMRIDAPGSYEFRTDSGYDRNELIVDGKVVCKFRDGSNKPGSIELHAGLIPVVSVGYAHSTTEVRVEWKPPGQEKFSEIPFGVLSH